MVVESAHFTRDLRSNESTSREDLLRPLARREIEIEAIGAGELTTNC